MKPSGNLIDSIDIQIPIFLFGLLAPLVVFFIIYSTPLGTVVIEDLMMHIVLSCIVIGFSFYTTWYYYTLYKKNPQIWLLTTSLSTFVFGIVFLAHILLMLFNDTSPQNIILLHIVEQYGSFISAFFLLGITLPFTETKGFLYENRKKLYVAIAVLLGAGMAGVFLSQNAANLLNSASNLVSISTGIMLLAASLAISVTFAKTHNLILLYYIFGCVVMASLGYIHLFPSEGKLIWWLSNFIFPIGYTTLFIGIINYERKDLDLRLFFGGIPFYKKIGTKLMLVILTIGLLPLLLFGLLMFLSIPNSFDELLLFRFVVAIMLLFVLAIFFSFYFVNKLIVPINTLSAAVAAFGKGEKEVQMDIRTGDEIETLATSFNGMVTELNKLHSGMQQTIAEQTEDLKDKLIAVNQSKTAILNLLEDSKELEMSLQDERDKSVTIISSISEGLFVVDEQYTIVLINPVAEKLLQTTKEDCVGKNMKDVVLLLKGDEIINDEDRPMTKTIKNGNNVFIGIEGNYYYQIPSGKKFPITLATSSIVTKGLRGAIVVFHDATEEKELEEAKSSFISTASHQLRTPLTSIRWYIEMLIDEDVGKLNKDQKEFAQQVYDGAVRLHDTINILLSLSRMESGKLQEEPVDINLKSIIGVITNELAPLITQKKLSVKVAVADDMQVKADTFMLHEVITNFVSNSIRYTNEGGSIAFQCSKGENETTCSIADDGIGIPDDQKDKIFGKFFRAENAVSKVPDGSGLGLNLVKGFVEKWGGRVWFESTFGSGTTFYFTIPHRP